VPASALDDAAVRSGVARYWRERRAFSLLEYEDVPEILRLEVAKVGSQERWAKRNGANRSTVSAALNGYRRIQPKFLKALGLKRIDAYIRVQ
jgi:hypothetical protein